MVVASAWRDHRPGFWSASSSRPLERCAAPDPDCLFAFDQDPLRESKSSWQSLGVGTNCVCVGAGGISLPGRIVTGSPLT